MATKEQLIQSMTKKLTEQFALEKEHPYNKDFTKKETILNCRNTRSITVAQFTPTESNKTGVIFYGYQFLTMDDPNAYTLEQIAEQMLLIGFANEDISGNAPDVLSNMGFVPEIGTNCCALSNMLMPDNYKLKPDKHTELGKPYEVNGVSYQDTMIKEYLTIYGKTIATRYIKLKTEPVTKGESDS